MTARNGTRKANKGILVVDDDPDHLLILRVQLEKIGYQVRTAENGRGALRILAEWVPDLVILDIIMPGMEGTEVCDQLKSHPRTKDVPFVFVTSLQRQDEENAPGVIAGNRIFAKPVNIDRLRTAIRELLGE